MISAAGTTASDATIGVITLPVPPLMILSVKLKAVHE
jgi:hypothetical protein